MILKIESINGFGIFKNFDWNSSPEIKNFNLKNLFYGWNYSGKTTLSRIFSSLRDKKVHECYSKGNFKIQTENNTFESSNLANFPYNILVFNFDYIKDNLIFSFHKDSTTESNTIFFEVGENAIYETKISQLKKQIDIIGGSETVIGKKAKFLKDIEEFYSFDKPYSGKFTVLAKEIKDIHFLSLINFSKANLKPIISNIKENLKDFIIKDVKLLASLTEIVKVSEPKITLNNIQINTGYNQIIENTNQILSKVPDKKILYKILDVNTEAYLWVKKGREFNEPNKKCLFCNNLISEERIHFLNQYFNSEASLVREKINDLKQLIAQEVNNIMTLNLPSSSNDFNLGFNNEYKILKKQYDSILSSYKKHLKNIIKKIDDKENKSLHFVVAKILPFKIEALQILVEKINQLITKNNEFSSDFSDRIEIEREKYINHLVALFLNREKYAQKEKKYNNAIIQIEKLNKKIQLYEKEIKRYESLKESDEEGAEQYSYFIQSFLNRNDIEIRLDKKTKKFILLRNNENASNLSEGEKTAIAFSHFLVSIKALESKGKFQDYIIFIDDPICSLDGNHIFQINSLFKETFFSQIQDPGNPKQNMWKINCKQLFISTHNFEFFNLMKELPKGKNGFDYVKNEKKCKESRYFIERNHCESTILDIPSIFDDYQSEYHFLFSEIVKFNNDPNKNSSDKLLVMPNVLRRFVEMYTLTKYPSKDEVDERANIVFGKLKSKRILKPLNYFSHYNNIDRIGKQNELIADLPAACLSLIEFIKQEDKDHFTALNKAIV